MKRLWATLLATGLLATHTVAATAAAWDFPNASTVPNGTTLVAVNEPNVFDAWSQWSSSEGGPEDYTSRLCPNGVDSLNCNPDKASVTATSVISACVDTQDQYCVDSIRVQSSNSGWVSATFSRGVEGQSYSASAQSAISAGRIGLWDVRTSNGTALQLASVVKVKQFYDNSKKRFVSMGLSANVTPYSVRAGGEAPVHTEGDYNGRTRVFTRHDPVCIWAEFGSCGLAEDFPEDLKVELKLRVPTEIKGWFRGRLQDPTISIDKVNESTNLISVQAKPVTVPRISVLANPSETPESVKTILSNTGGKNPTAPLFSGNSIKDFFSNQGERLFEVINGLRATAKDTTQGLSTLWNFTTIEFSSKESCFAGSSEVLGIVTTNASAYVGDPPAFKDGMLEYRVAGFHFAPDGKTLNLGTYDLIMNSKVARCLYGFSNAPVSAKIQVVSENGESVVASTTVSEQDGWLKLAAYGFTFSEKKIKVELSQAKPQLVKLTLGSFASKAANLNLKQKSAVDSVAANVDFQTQAECKGTYKSPNEKSLALSRANAVCARLLSKKPGLSAVVKVSKVSTSKQSNLVLVSIN